MPLFGLYCHLCALYLLRNILLISHVYITIAPHVKRLASLFKMANRSYFSKRRRVHFSLLCGRMTSPTGSLWRDLRPKRSVAACLEKEVPEETIDFHLASLLAELRPFAKVTGFFVQAVHPHKGDSAVTRASAPFCSASYQMSPHLC